MVLTRRKFMDELNMTRRHFLASSGVLAASGVTGLGGAFTERIAGATRPRPSAAQLAWQDAELGLLYSYDLHIFDGVPYVQRENRLIRFDDANIFRPRQLDTDQWIQSAVDAGARFAILTTSHENGFRLWQSDANPFCLKATGWRDGKGDVVRDFVNSCRAHGIKPGIYIGARWNGRLGVFDFKVTRESPVTQQEYNTLIEQECLELATRYGELFEVWFDGGIATPDAGGPDVVPIWEKHQPDCLFYHSNQRRDVRWGGSESGTVPYPCWAAFPDSSFATYTGGRSSLELLKQGDPDGNDWCPAMSDAPLRGFQGHEWFWEPDDEQLIYPLEKLVDMYERSVGHNSTLILGVTPDDRGLLPDADVERLKAFGAEIDRRYGEAIATTQGRGSEVTLTLPDIQRVDRVVIQEEISQGERIRAYTLEGLVGGDWIGLGEGSCVGHKHIQRIEPAEIAGLRLRVSRSVDTPIIQKLAVFDTSRVTPGPQWAQRLEFVGVAVEEPGYHVWGTSPIIGPEGKTHLFVARWPVSAAFTPGWHTECEIAHYVGNTPEGPFRFTDVALKGTGKETWDRLAPHNPTVHQVGNQYVLLYIANTGTEGFPANQRIGMAMADDLHGPWRKVGGDGLVLSPPTDSSVWSHGSRSGVNNPAFLIHPDGRFFLYYKAAVEGDVPRMGVAIADRIEGPYAHYPNPLTSNTRTIEDGYVFMEDQEIWLLTTDNDRGAGLLWRSDDGLDFGDPTVGFEQMNRYVDEGVLQEATNYRGRKFERPQILVQDGQPTHLYVASGANLNKGDGSCSYVLKIKN